MAGEPALLFRHVRRTFGQTVALDRLDLAVPPGIVLGLVGRNGAGKTTALRLAHGHLWPDAGEIRVLGLDPRRDPLAVRRRVALMSEENHLCPWMTVEEITWFAGRLHPCWDADLAQQLRRRLDLPARSRIRSLSRGGRARVALLLAVAACPELLLLDDPTSGLDPLARRDVLEELLAVLVAEGRTVAWASHLVHDLERVADRIAVIDAGRVVLEEDVEALKNRVRGVTAVFPAGAPDPEVLPGRLRARRDGRVLEGVSDAPPDELVARLRAAGARTVDLRPLALEEILVARLGPTAAPADEPDRKETIHA